MTKTTKNILIIVVIAILVFALICIIYQHYSQKPLPKTVIGEGEILPDANSGLENIINDILDENVTEPEEDEKNKKKIKQSQQLQYQVILQKMMKTK